MRWAYKSIGGQADRGIIITGKVSYAIFLRSKVKFPCFRSMMTQWWTRSTWSTTWKFKTTRRCLASSVRERWIPLQSGATEANSSYHTWTIPMRLILNTVRVRQLLYNHFRLIILLYVLHIYYMLFYFSPVLTVTNETYPYLHLSLGSVANPKWQKS